MNQWTVNRLDRKKYEFFIDNEPAGELKYPGWNPYNASLVIYGGDRYEIRRLNFWKRTYSLLQNEMEIGQMRTNWRGRIDINLKWDNLSTDYLFRRIGIWKPVYSLSDASGNDIFSVKAAFRFRNFAYQFTVESSIRSTPEPLDKLLFLLSVYLTNFLIAKAQSHSTAAIS